MLNLRYIARFLLIFTPFISATLLYQNSGFADRMLVGTSRSLPTLSVPPRSALTPWIIDQTPTPVVILKPRQTANAMSASTSTSNRATYGDSPVLVALSRITSLLKAICGFNPFWDGNKQTLRTSQHLMVTNPYSPLWSDIIGCAGSQLVVDIKIEFGRDEACVKNGEKLSCNLATTLQPLSGCVDPTYSTLRKSTTKLETECEYAIETSVSEDCKSSIAYYQSGDQLRYRYI